MRFLAFGGLCMCIMRSVDDDMMFVDTHAVLGGQLQGEDGVR